MKWLLLAFAFLSLTIKWTQSTERVVSEFLDYAMLGIDPITFNILDQPDQGMKGQIFEGIEVGLPIKPNKFVEVTHEGCTPQFFADVIHSFENYRRIVSSYISFDPEDGSVASSELPEFSFENNVGYGSIHEPKVLFLRDFLNQTGGEVILVRTECITCTVKINDLVQSILTHSFFTVSKLLQNRKTYDVVIWKDFIYKFFRFYGTHYASTTNMGSKAIFGMMFPTRAGPGEVEARRQCVEDSARESLDPTARWNNESVSLTFTRVVAEKCGKETPQTLVTLLGPVPTGSLDDWASDARMSPRPVRWSIVKIGNIFKYNSQFSSPLSAFEKLNREAILEFIEENTANFSQAVVDRAKKSLSGPCVHETFKPEKPTGAPDPEPTDSGSIIIVGGKSATRTPSSLHSFALFNQSPPLFPHEVFGNTLSSLDDTLYSCGGINRNNKVCWVYDSKTQDTWQAIDIPWQLIYHSAVVVNDEIWFFSDSRLRILRPKNPTNKSSEIELGFSFGLGIRAETHDSKTFVIGVGSEGREVQVNTDPSQPEQWKSFALLTQGRYEFGSIVFDNEIWVTGGIEKISDIRLPSVEAINVINGTVRILSSLGDRRRSHQMAIIGGRPAVLGGLNRAAMASIQIHDEQKDVWETMGYSLSDPRYHFGLTQYFS